jgi:outer membrane lipoprotein-sorting protein
MNQNKNEKWLDKLISGAVGSGEPQLDTARWKEKFPEEFEMLKSRAAQGLTRRPTMWRMIMKSGISKLAAAAVIIIAVLAAVHFIGGSVESVAWADVVRPLMTARTVAFNVIMGQGENETITRVMNNGTQRVRNEVLLLGGKAVQLIQIIDYDTSQMLTLNPERKTAVLIDLKDMPEKPENPLEAIRNMIRELQEDPAFSVKSLGEQEIDGQIAEGFRAAGPDGELTIWADPETALPIRMEQKWRQMQFVCTDYDFDVALDESLFSMEIPEGYSALSQAELAIASSTEQDLVETLRIWAEIILDGIFPKDFSGQVYMDDVNKNREKFATLQDEEKLELALKMGPGFIFVQLLKDENDWHYVGTDVKLGDRESPVCWYRATGSETYRVIYGDLRVEDVAAEDLPK